MKKFTVILTAALMLLAGTQANAQMSIGAGYVNSVESSKISKTANPSNYALNGFYAGLGYTIPVVGGLNFTPGVYYEFLTLTTTIRDELAGVSRKVTEHYINVPLTFSFGVKLTDGFRLFAYAGPTAAIGLASTTQYEGNLGSIAAGTTIDNYDKNNDYGRFNILVGGGLGFEIAEMIRLNVGYEWGLLNRYTGGDENLSIRDTRLTAGVAFLF
jgi:opacity protein-like surface antigen